MSNVIYLSETSARELFDDKSVCAGDSGWAIVTDRFHGYYEVVTDEEYEAMCEPEDGE